MKSLAHSRLISGMLIGAIPGGLLLLFSMAEISQRTACLILIGVGSTLGLLAGLAKDIEPQIKWVPDHRLRRTWRSVSVQFIRNRLRHGFGSQSLSIFLVCATVLLWGCAKLPVTKYWSWSLTVDKPALEFYQRSPTTTEILRRVKFTSAVTVGAWIGMAMLRVLILRNQQGFISDNMMLPETADVAIAVYQRRFRRRTILLPFVGICMCTGWLAWNLRAANQQHQIVSLVFQLGGGVSYDFEANPELGRPMGRHRNRLGS